MAASFVLGIGVLAYVAFWIILPADHGATRGTGLRSTIVTLAIAFAGFAGLATLALVAGAATVFGFGGVVAVLVGVLLIGALWFWPRVSPAWLLLPIIALTLPALLVTASDTRLNLQTDDVVVAPKNVKAITDGVEETGFGRMLVDLRDTPFPDRGTVHLRLRTGLRRAIVALPHDHCVRVRVRYRVNEVPFNVARIVTRRGWHPVQELRVFGTPFGALGSGVLDGANFIRQPKRGPTLLIDFRSAGGGLYVRDYPDYVDPNMDVNWPGFGVYPEPRPSTIGVPRQAARRLIKHWRERRAVQERSKRRVNPLIPGPCSNGDRA